MPIFSKILNSVKSGVESVLRGFTVIDEELFEQLEETLILCDVGVETATALTERLRQRVQAERVSAPEAIQSLLADEVAKMLRAEAGPFDPGKPAVILVTGVNGVGKTTTIGKLAHLYQSRGRKVLLAAADTFRAAAIDQLEIWARRAGVDVIRHQENSDPAAVVFDAVQAAKARGIDLLICDTAGRLHNKKNLMEELKKIRRIIDQNYADAEIHVLLVLDATTGQNALQQAKVFQEVAGVTGLVLTKVDGTAKGGIIIAIGNELRLPVWFIGTGEGLDDLEDFAAEEFARGLFES